jgi:hypothetical protein
LLIRYKLKIGDYLSREFAISIAAQAQTKNPPVAWRVRFTSADQLEPEDTS